MHAKNQAALNDCTYSDERTADAELNRTYQQVIKKYSNEPEFIEKLREAQRIWIEFREAELKMKFPPKPGLYGSSEAMCEGDYRTQLIRERTKQLKKWLIGIEEGDVCSGSVKTPEALK